jgi:hypothetical protein
MKLAIVTAYPPSKVTLNEYAYHLVKSFRLKEEVSELILLTDETPEEKEIHFKQDGCKITIIECWKFKALCCFLWVLEKTLFLGHGKFRRNI